MCQEPRVQLPPHCFCRGASIAARLYAAPSERQSPATLCSSRNTVACLLACLLAGATRLAPLPLLVGFVRNRGGIPVRFLRDRRKNETKTESVPSLMWVRFPLLTRYLTGFISNQKHKKQEDAHEFLRHLVDKMAGSFLRRRGAEATAAPIRPAEASPIHGIFGGCLRSQVRYTRVAPYLFSARGHTAVVAI